MGIVKIQKEEKRLIGKEKKKKVDNLKKQKPT